MRGSQFGYWKVSGNKTLEVLTKGKCELFSCLWFGFLTGYQPSKYSSPSAQLPGQQAGGCPQRGGAQRGAALKVWRDIATALYSSSILQGPARSYGIVI